MLVPLDAYVSQACDLDVALDSDNLDAVADLALRINQDCARRAGAVLTGVMQRSYLELSEGERAGMRSGVERVIMALVLLGYIDMPA